MRAEHPGRPGVHPETPMVLEARPCATLGTNFCDVYLDGELFAAQLSRPVAESFVREPWQYPRGFIDATKLRTYAIEQDDANRPTC